MYGLRNQQIQDRLLETVNLTMEAAFKTASGMELAEKGVNDLKPEATVAVDFIGAGPKSKKTDGETKPEGQIKNNKQERKKNKFVR